MAGRNFVRLRLSIPRHSQEPARRCHGSPCNHQFPSGRVGGMERRMEFLVNERIPCVVFEDDHLLAVHKPPGLNTHSPAPWAGEGLYEWLKNREPRWANLAIIHRLDKETSGLIVFGKTSAANRSLTAQFSEHSVRKKYSL